jgi:hypothetical protein
MLVLFAVCLLLAVIAVTDISASYLRRQATTSLADGAALAATEAAAASSVYGSPDDRYIAIDPVAAQAAVDTYLRDTTGAYAAYPGLRASVMIDGFTVRVALTMPYELPVRVPGVRQPPSIPPDPRCSPSTKAARELRPRRRGAPTRCDSRAGRGANWCAGTPPCLPLAVARSVPPSRLRRDPVGGEPPGRDAELDFRERHQAALVVFDGNAIAQQLIDHRDVLDPGDLQWSA